MAKVGLAIIAKPTMTPTQLRLHRFHRESLGVHCIKYVETRVDDKLPITSFLVRVVMPSHPWNQSKWLTSRYSWIMLRGLPHCRSGGLSLLTLVFSFKLRFTLFGVTRIAIAII